MNVSRAQIVVRGLTHSCPNCGAHTLFKQGTFFRLNRSCPACGSARVKRMLSLFAMKSEGGAVASTVPSGGGSCCGGGCSCH